VQVVGIPVSGDQTDTSSRLAKTLRSRGVRVEVDASDDRMQKKIRNHTLQKVPFLLLARPRRRGGRDQLPVPDGTQRNGCRWSRRSRPSSSGSRAGRTPRRRHNSTRGPRDGPGAPAGPPELVGLDGPRFPDGFRRLWTPHRWPTSEAAASSAEEGCPFCRIPKLTDETAWCWPGDLGVRGAQPAPYNPAT